MTTSGRETDEAPATGLEPALYLVATPIGNASDLTLRAIETLRGAGAIACEDTRLTGRLLARHGIRNRLLPYHEHNAAQARPAILERLRRGEAIALVSDAGTPLVSDPGFKLVEEAIAAGLKVTAVPGASAILTALQLSGLPSDRFMFAGFLPPRSAARRKAIGEFVDVPATLILFESPRRLADCLADLAAVLGDRPAAIARELTKLFEEVRRGTLGSLASQYAAEDPPKGEIVIVVGRGERKEPPEAADVDALLQTALESASVRDAARDVAAATGLPRRAVYMRALQLSRGTR